MPNKTLSYTLYQANAGRREVESETQFPHPVEVHDLESLRKAVKWQYSPAKLVNGIRSSENFESANVIVMDIDNEHSDNEQDWIKPENIKELFPDVHCYWETSRSHMREKKKKSGKIVSPRPRLHVHFPLGEVVENDPEEYRELKTRVYNCYPNIFDGKDLAAVQMKYVSKSAQVGVVEGSKTILEYLDEYAPKVQKQPTKKAIEPKQDKPSEPQGDPNGPYIYNETYYQYCLDYIDPVGMPRDPDWLCVGMALKHVGMSEDMFIEWCWRDPSWTGEKETEGMRREFRSFKKKLPGDAGYKGSTLTQLAINSVGKKAFYANMPEECIKRPSIEELFDALDQAELNGKKKPSISELGKVAVKELNAIHLEGPGLHIYLDGKGYISEPRQINRAVHRLFKGKLPSTTIENICKYMANDAPEKEEAPRNLIQFKNAILDVSTGEIIPRSPDIFITQTIPWDYDPDAPAVEFVDRVFNEWACGDPKVVKVMFQSIGYALYRGMPLHAFFILTGDGRNGKSVFCFVVKAIVGSLNYAAVPMSQLNERFAPAAFAHKLVNICEENEGKYREENRNLKIASSGGTMLVEQKGKPAYETRVTGKHFYCFNSPFTNDDKTGALLARIVHIPFLADFSDPEKQDRQLEDKLCKPECIQYIIRKAVEELRELLSQDHGWFAQTEYSKNWLHEQRFRDNPIEEFIEDIRNDNVDDYIEELSSDSSIYSRIEITNPVKGMDFFTSYPIKTVIHPTFLKWCEDNRGNNQRKMSYRNFRDEVSRRLKFTTYRPNNGHEKKRQVFFKAIDSIDENQMYE